MADSAGEDEPRSASGLVRRRVYEQEPRDPDAICEPGTFRSPAACTRAATAAGSGRCGSTPASAPPPSRTAATATCSSTAPPASRWPSTCPPRSATTPTIPQAAGEVGRVGVAIDSLEDMESSLDGIPLERVSTSMTINATAAILLALYVAVARRRGIAEDALSGTVQNDILKEYVARGTYIYPPGPRCASSPTSSPTAPQQRAAVEPDLDLRLPHPRGGSDGAAGDRVHLRERPRVRARGAAPPGSIPTGSASGSRSSSPATPTSSRRWRSSAPRGGCGPGSCRSGSGVDNPQGPAAAASTSRRAASRSPRSSPTTTWCGWRCRRWPRCSAAARASTPTRKDEALALPTEASARLALRTQQVIAFESGVADTVDPLGGSYAVEAATDALEREACALLDRDRGARAARSRAIERGEIQREIQESAYRLQREVEAGERVIVGVNRFAEAAEAAARRHPAHRSRAGARAGRARAGAAGAARRRGPGSASLDALEARARGGRQPGAGHDRRGAGLGHGGRDRGPAARRFGEHRRLSVSARPRLKLPSARAAGRALRLPPSRPEEAIALVFLLPTT